MPRRTANNCTDDHLDIPEEVLDALPKSQRPSTGVRHKCAACAYQAGVKEGIRRARKALMKVAREAMPIDVITGKRREPELGK
jgi:hypothetical protein